MLMELISVRLIVKIVIDHNFIRPLPALCMYLISLCSQTLYQLKEGNGLVNFA